MFKRTKVNVAAVALVSGVGLLASAAFAQTGQRIEITGSSIKRVDAETALPIQVITAEDIKRTGVTSVTDLIQSLPAMQGFTTNSQSVNGGGGGAATAALHALDSKYTLVLLNGRRLAPYTTGATVNLNTLPLSVIERVEVLTDGASALYGSDAIAGVVNFITKRDTTEGSATATINVPQHPGGGSTSMSLSKGFGDLSTDKFNVLVAISADTQKKLDATQRPFSKTGILTFKDQGADQEIDLLSSNSVPGNARSVKGTRADGTAFNLNFNPYLLKNGTCPVGQVKTGNQCFFDFSATVESIPDSSRIGLFSSARFAASATTSLFAELSFSRFYNDPRYAPPAQPGIRLPASIIASSVTPYLPKLGIVGGTVTSANVNLRLADAGGRADRYQTDSTHVVLGVDTTVGNWDLTGSFVHSANKFTDSAIGGYSSLNAFNALMASGKFDPLFSVAGSAKDLIAPIVLHQVLDTSKSSLDVLSVRASTTLGKLPGGAIGLGVGADYNSQKYSDNPSAILMGNNALQPNFTDAIVGGGGGALPFDSTRKSYGLFGEVQLPVIKELEITGSARYDSYGAVGNTKNFDQNGNPLASATQGASNSSGTYKLSLKFTPTKDLLVRGSIGTGFKVPSLSNITSPLAAFGSTGFHICPPGLSAAKATSCAPISQEYNIQAGGNPDSGAGAIKPEKSSQWTIGFRFEPSQALSIGADLWTVKLKDQVNTITENTAFSDGKKYENLFKVAPDPITGTPTLTFLSVPINTGDAYYQGVDIDIESRLPTPVGKLTTRLHATYMIRADYQTPGTPGFINSLQKIGSDGQLVSRYLINLSSNLVTGNWSNTLTANYRPGYMDDTADYCQTDANGNCLLSGTDQRGRRVASFVTWDWQTRFDMNKQLQLTLGLKNMFDKKPPYSVLNQSGTGNVRGYDPRYADPIGRQVYLTGNYKF